MRRLALMVGVVGVLWGLAGCYPTRWLREVIAVTHGASLDEVRVTVFSDNGRDTEEAVWKLDARTRQLSAPIGAGPPAAALTEDCAGGACYRVVPGQLRVDEKLTAGYAPAWQLTGDTYRRLAAGYPDLGDPALHLSSRSLVVVAVPGGHVVFVADGRDGLLARDVSGRWQRLGIPEGAEGLFFHRPPRLATDPQPVNLSPYAAIPGALLVLLAGVVTAWLLRTRRPWQPTVAVLVVAVAAGTIAALAVHAPDVGMFPGPLIAGPALL